MAGLTQQRLSKVILMKPTALILAALVLPLIWGYVAEQLLRRIWRRRPDPFPGEKTTRPLEREPQTQFPDYQI